LARDSAWITLLKELSPSGRKTKTGARQCGSHSNPNQEQNRLPN
jgi:hypothetical protein